MIILNFFELKIGESKKCTFSNPPICYYEKITRFRDKNAKGMNVAQIIQLSGWPKKGNFIAKEIKNAIEANCYFGCV